MKSEQPIIRLRNLSSPCEQRLAFDGIKPVWQFVV